MAQSKKRILVVDDDEDVAGTLKVMLENYGFDIDCFTDPSIALQKFKPNLYDLTILDIRMPDPNGFKLYDQLYSRDPNIKTLFITAPSSVESYNTQNSEVYTLTRETLHRLPLALTLVPGTLSVLKWDSGYWVLVALNGEDITLALESCIL